MALLPKSHVTLDIKRYAKFRGGCVAPARLHMQLYLIIETVYKSWTCTSYSNTVFYMIAFCASVVVSHQQEASTISSFILQRKCWNFRVPVTSFRLLLFASDFALSSPLFLLCFCCLGFWVVWFFLRLSTIDKIPIFPDVAMFCRNSFFCQTWVISLVFNTPWYCGALFYFFCNF